MAVPPAAAQLFARSFPPPWSRPSVARVLALCEKVAGAVPCGTLSFARDASAVGAVLDALD
jgi:hypothetical protein